MWIFYPIQRVHGLPRSRRSLPSSLLNMVLACPSFGLRTTCQARHSLPYFILFTISISWYACGIQFVVHATPPDAVFQFTAEYRSQHFKFENFKSSPINFSQRPCKNRKNQSCTTRVLFSFEACETSAGFAERKMSDSQPRN